MYSQWKIVQEMELATERLLSRPYILSTIRERSEPEKILAAS
jgi:hypothetical protein